MMKKFVIALAVLALVGGTAVFAQDNSGANLSIKEKIEDRREDRREDRKQDGAQVALTAEQVACIKTAVGKREDALSAGVATYSTAITSAYTARKTALLAAWEKTDKTERRTAVKAADRAFADAVKAARKAWGETRRAAWKTFETDRKACVPNASLGSSDTGSSRTDGVL